MKKVVESQKMLLLPLICGPFVWLTTWAMEGALPDWRETTFTLMLGPIVAALVFAMMKTPRREGEGFFYPRLLWRALAVAGCWLVFLATLGEMPRWWLTVILLSSVLPLEKKRDKGPMRPLPHWVLAAFAALMIFFFIFQVVFISLHRHRAPQFSELGSGFVSLFFTFLICAVLLLYEAREAKRTAELRAAEAESKQLRAQVATLTAQMNPHLLFNTLNTIAALTGSNPKAAESVTLQLAELYRRVLDATKREVHSLAEELAICRAYLAIEKARFSDRLSFDISATTGEDKFLPVLALQPLVENAVKHGIAPLPNGGMIRIRTTQDDRTLTIAVEDSGAGLDAPSKPQSTALGNLRARLALIYGESASFSLRDRDGGGAIASLSIPLSWKPQ